MNYERTKPDRAAVICFTAGGMRTAEQIRPVLQRIGLETDVWCKKQNVPADHPGCMILEEPLRDWTGKRFKDSSLIVFVSATGIAVRSIAPFLVSKVTDPAVLNIDEMGKFVISLVSGHMGGANEAAEKVAEHLGAVCVVTTATDLNGRFAVDVFAKRNGLLISDMKLAKQISARILDGETITVISDLPVCGELPGQLRLLRGGKEEELPRQSADIYIGFREVDPGERKSEILRLVPRILTVGMGCRKNRDVEALRSFFEESMRRFHLAPEAVCRVCSIDLKAHEPGLTALAEGLGVPFSTYTAEELAACPGDFSSSGFVKSVTGVDNVCERSAVLGSAGFLVMPRQAGDGITMAAACADRRIRFE